MCELLVMARDKHHNDPVKNQAGSYKRGDIVTVMPDGKTWGDMECLPNFFIIKLPGVPEEVMRKYQKTEKNENVTANWACPVRTRREYRINIDNLRSNEIQQLEREGELTLTYSRIQGRLYNKRTRLTE